MATAKQRIEALEKEKEALIQENQSLKNGEAITRNQLRLAMISGAHPEYICSAASEIDKAIDKLLEVWKE